MKIIELFYFIALFHLSLSLSLSLSVILKSRHLKSNHASALVLPASVRYDDSWALMRVDVLAMMRVDVLAMEVIKEIRVRLR
jgi:hypothetical protein